MQEVFTRAWRHAERYDPERASVRTWLYQIARHAIIDARRRAAVRPGLPLHEPGPGSEPVGESVEQAMLGWQVAMALERLSPDHRQMIRLAHVQGLTMREIAEHTDLPVGTVKSRTWYALRRCGSCSRRWGSGERRLLPRAPPAAGRLRLRGARARRGRRRAHAPGRLPRVRRRARLAGRAAAPARPRRAGRRSPPSRWRRAPRRRCSTASPASPRAARARASPAAARLPRIAWTRPRVALASALLAAALAVGGDARS